MKILIEEEYISVFFFFVEIVVINLLGICIEFRRFKFRWIYKYISYYKFYKVGSKFIKWSYEN